MQLLAFFVQTLVLNLRLRIVHERVDTFADGLKLGLLNKGFAQFACLLAEQFSIRSICLHIGIWLRLVAIGRNLPALRRLRQ